MREDNVPVGRPMPHPPCDGRCVCGCHEHDRETYRAVGGFCPMGCGETLGIPVWPKTHDASMVRCFAFTCPDPRALEKILRDPETEHQVTFAGDQGFTVKHPLKERTADLAKCPFHAWLMEHRPDAADVPGLYRAVPAQPSDLDPAGWRFILLQPTEVAD